MDYGSYKHNLKISYWYILQMLHEDTPFHFLFCVCWPIQLYHC